MRKQLIFFCLFLCNYLANAQPSATVHGLFKKSKEYRTNYESQKAIELAKKAYNLAKIDQDSLMMGNSLIQIGHNQKDIDQYEDCLQSYFQALAIFSSLGNSEMIARTYNNISLVKEKLGEYRDGIRFAKFAVQNATESFIAASAYNNMANNYDGRGLQDSAIVANENAVRMLEKQTLSQNDSVLLADSYLGLGNRYGDKGDYKTSNKYYHKALEFFEMLDDMTSSALVYMNRAVNKMEVGEHEQSEEDFGKAEVLFKQFDFVDSLALSELYSNWAILKLNVNNINEASRFSRLAVDYDKANSKNLLDILTAVTKANEARRRLIYTIIFIFFGGVIFGFVFFRERKIMRLERDAIEKREKEVELRDEVVKKNKELITTKETFSKVKHDYIKNLAIEVKNHLIVLKTSGVQKLAELNQQIINLNKLIYIAETPINDMSKIFQSENPKALSRFIKEMYLKAQKVSNMTNLPVPREEDYEDVKDFLVKPAVQSEVMQSIIGNAFDNIRLHAKAKKAVLMVAADNRKLEIVIEDDGNGFDRSKVNGTSSGLKHIEAAAIAAGGTAEIHSVIGEGTSIRVILKNPFVDEEASADASKFDEVTQIPSSN